MALQHIITCTPVWEANTHTRTHAHTHTHTHTHTHRQAAVVAKGNEGNVQEQLVQALDHNDHLTNQVVLLVALLVEPS